MMITMIIRRVALKPARLGTSIPENTDDTYVTRRLYTARLGEKNSSIHSPTAMGAIPATIIKTSILWESAYLGL